MIMQRIGIIQVHPIVLFFPALHRSIKVTGVMLGAIGVCRLWCCCCGVRGIYCYRGMNRIDMLGTALSRFKACGTVWKEAWEAALRLTDSTVHASLVKVTIGGRTSGRITLTNLEEIFPSLPCFIPTPPELPSALLLLSSALLLILPFYYEPTSSHSWTCSRRS